MIEKNCVICSEYINDPVCIYCYIKQVKLCLADQNINTTIINYIQTKIKNTYVIESINDIECLICKKESVNICFYCVSRIIFRVLSELNFSYDVIDKMSEFFNYNSFEYDTMNAEDSGYNKDIFNHINLSLKGGE